MPAVALLEGCVCNPSREAVAALMATLVEVAPASVPLANCMVILVATPWDRFVKVTMPLMAVAFVFPRSVPLPTPRLAVTTVLLSLLRKLPN